MDSQQDARVSAAWDADVSYLLAIANGMLGRPAAAEDVVQEAFSRLATADVEQIEDVRGWLVVVTRRLCLNHLGSADAKRTSPAAILPDSGDASSDPADRLTLDDDVRRAFTVVIDRLSPAMRTAFLLHDVFGFPFDDVAALVGRTPAACRQLASRARESIRVGSYPRSKRSDNSHAADATQIAERFIAACDGGDVQQLIALLDPQASGTGNIVCHPAPRPTTGAKSVARQALSFLGPRTGLDLEPLMLEESPAVVARSDGRVIAVVRLGLHAGRIVDIHAVAHQYVRRNN